MNFALQAAKFILRRALECFVSYSQPTLAHQIAPYHNQQSLV
jgi:hypothetical protein